MTTLSELEAAAKDATQKWHEFGGDEGRDLIGICRKENGLLRWPLLIEITGDNHKSDAKYIALANPQTILSMIVDMRALGEALKIQGGQETLTTIGAKNEALQNLKKWGI